MAKDGTRRGGARVCSGRKTSKTSPPLINFDADFDAENDGFEVKNGKKSTEKCKKSADLGTKNAENSSKISKNSPKTGRKSPKTAENPPETAKKSTKKSGTASKTPGKSASAAAKTRKSVKKDADKVSDSDIPEEKAAVKTKTPAKSQGKSTASAVKSRKTVKKTVDKADDDIPELEGADVPPVDEYLRAQQRCGKSLRADYIFNQTMKWLRKIKCEGAVSKQLVEQYAMSVARWIQTEELISEYGFLAKHPTTGQAMASPYVRMSQDYMKQVNQIWYQIYQIVKESCGEGVLGNSDDPMERLLKQRGG